ncbi:MAG: S-formylglutathione hydrolase [Micavibrio sp.]|nr:S-formylglutathione hydrolase [Micavibrio sp.]
MLKKLEEHACHGGALVIYEHASEALNCDMKFSVFLPPQITDGKRPAVMFLAGLTCTHDNFTTKAGAYKKAAELGLIIIAPDTSPRGSDVPDDDNYDFGKGAGFYVNATQKPWNKHFHMESYITDELYNIIHRELPVREGRLGIMGHSMGGHGALTLYFKYPEKFVNCSAFSPIVAPAEVPWGRKAFKGYLGEDKTKWIKHDACALVREFDTIESPMILIDQGLGDQFLTEQLKPELFETACKDAGQALKLRLHEGYDHSYYFISSFIEDHLTHHAEVLSA